MIAESKNATKIVNTSSYNIKGAGYLLARPHLLKEEDIRALKGVIKDVGSEKSNKSL